MKIKTHPCVCVMAFLYPGYKQIPSDAVNNVIHVQMSEYKGITHSVLTGPECPEEVSGVSFKEAQVENNPSSEVKSVHSTHSLNVSADVRKPIQSARQR